MFPFSRTEVVTLCADVLGDMLSHHVTCDMFGLDCGFEGPTKGFSGPNIGGSFTGPHLGQAALPEWQWQITIKLLRTVDMSSPPTTHDDDNYDDLDGKH